MDRAQGVVRYVGANNRARINTRAFTIAEEQAWTRGCTCYFEPIQNAEQFCRL